MAAPIFAQLQKTTLKAPISETEKGAILISGVTDIYGYLPTIAQFGGRIRVTFSPGGDDEEITYCTGFTRNADSSVTLDTGIIRGQDASLAGTGFGKAHSAGTIVVLLPDNPQLWNEVIAYINGIALASAVPASTTQVGYVLTSANLANPRVPVVLVSQQASPNMTLLVNPFSIATLDQNVNFVGGSTGIIVAPVSNSRIDLIVFSTVSGTVVIRSGTESASPTTASPVAGDIPLASIFNRVGETSIKETSDGTNGYVYSWYQPALYNPNVVPAGTVIESSARGTPSGYLLPDGTAVSRTTYANLFNAICPAQTFTVTIASPAIVTANGHGLVIGDKIHFTTTGGFPSGMTSNTDYYVISTGLTTNTFEFALSPGGNAVNTTGTQSGIQTLYKSAYGKGDGSSTFNLPDRRAKVALALAPSAPTITLAFEPAAVDVTNNWVTFINNVFPTQGQSITLTTTGTLPAGLSLATTYYIVRLTGTTFAFASTQANANNITPALVDITDQGLGVHTVVFTNNIYTVLGRALGEETHGIDTNELAAHVHTTQNIVKVVGSGGNLAGTATLSTGTATSDSTGGNGQHNNIQPSLVQNFFIKY